MVSDSTKKEQYMDVDKVACEILEDIREKADKELKRQVDELKKERKLPESICPKYDIVAISVPSMSTISRVEFFVVRQNAPDLAKFNL